MNYYGFGEDKPFKFRQNVFLFFQQMNLKIGQSDFAKRRGAVGFTEKGATFKSASNLVNEDLVWNIDVALDI